MAGSKMVKVASRSPTFDLNAPDVKCQKKGEIKRGIFANVKLMAVV